MSNIFRGIAAYIGSGDRILWALIVTISVYSLALVKSVSGDMMGMFLVQLAAISMGLLGALVLQSINYKVIADKWIFIGIFCILFIIYTLIFGISIEGSSGINAKAWIRLFGGVTFQPSELVKIGFIITFSKHLSILMDKGKIKDLKSIVLLGIHAMIPAALTHMQGDDGATIIFLCMAICMAFIAGVPSVYFICACILGTLMLPVIWKYVLADYQKQRLINQLDPESDPLNMGYQQIQGKLSIASGGISGYGLFKGPRVANGSVPIQESDFIFSVAGEELGFIGCIIVIVLLLSLFVRIAFVAKSSYDSVGMLMCFGFLGLTASQAIFNLGMCLSLLPVMGVTLPFFSAGGSSVSCLYLGIGLIQSVYVNGETSKIRSHRSSK